MDAVVVPAANFGHQSPSLAELGSWSHPNSVRHLESHELAAPRIENRIQFGITPACSDVGMMTLGPNL